MVGPGDKDVGGVIRQGPGRGDKAPTHGSATPVSMVKRQLQVIRDPAANVGADDDVAPVGPGDHRGRDAQELQAEASQVARRTGGPAIAPPLRGGGDGIGRQWHQPGPADAPHQVHIWLLNTSPSPRDRSRSRMPSSA